MYERFFGLRERPFELTPDPRFLFLSPSHREALSNLQFGIAARKSLTVLIGEVGSGKTTLVRRTLTVAKEEGWRCIFLKNPQLSPDEFATFFARELGIDQSAELPRWERLEAIERRLGKLRTAGEAVGLIVDEAQNLSDALFEELRQLTNFETDTEKLLSGTARGPTGTRPAAQRGGPASSQAAYRAALCSSAADAAGDSRLHSCTHRHRRWTECHCIYA